MGIMSFLKKGAKKPVSSDSRPAQQPAPAKAPERKQEIYTVQAGDSLSKIANKYFGDMKQWPRIFDANRNVLSDPDKIQPGQKLVIPL